MELDFPDDVGDDGLARLAGGEVAGFLGFAGTAAVGAVADEGAGQEDLEEERGEGKSWMSRDILSCARTIRSQPFLCRYRSLSRSMSASEGRSAAVVKGGEERFQVRPPPRRRPAGSW